MALAQIHVAAWQAAYRGVMPDAFLDGLDVRQRTERWRQTLAGAGGPGAAPEVVLVVELDDGPPLGFAITGPEREPAPHSETRGELWAMNIAPDAWGRGLGRLLLQAAERALSEAGYADAVLWVVAANGWWRRTAERAVSTAKPGGAPTVPRSVTRGSASRSTRSATPAASGRSEPATKPRALPRAARTRPARASRPGGPDRWRPPRRVGEPARRPGPARRPARSRGSCDAG